MVEFTFDKTNQIIQCESPDAEFTIQELFNAVRDYEDDFPNIEVNKIADAYGKQDLGGGVLVGITMVLYDWKVQFEPRGGPDWELCNIRGGNLVRYDTGTEQYGNPVNPTAYVTVTLTSSSSATISMLELQELYYDGMVVIDVDGGEAGTEFPIGTQAHPVNNLADAKTIADNLRFEHFHVTGNITLSGDFSGYTFEAHSPSVCTITLNNQNVEGSNFINVKLTGQQNGRVRSHFCELNGITDLYGEYTEAIIASNLTVKSGEWAYLWGVHSIGVNSYDINMNETGSIGITESILECTVKNMTDSGSKFFKHGQGLVTVDDTCSAGEVRIGGEASHFGEGTGTCTVIDDTTRWMVWEEKIADHTTAETAGHTMEITAYLGKVWIDVDNGYAGTEFPVGTHYHPVNNITDARTIADNLGFREFHCVGSITLDQAYQGYIFTSDNYNRCTINMNGQPIGNSVFNAVKITGSQSGFIYGNDLAFGAITGMQGIFKRCWITTNLKTSILGILLFRDTQTLTPFIVNIDANGSGMVGFAGDSTGVYRIKNMTSGIALFGAEKGCEIYGHSSCTAGTIRFGGYTTWHDEGVTCTVNSDIIWERVWDQLLVDHVISGSTGEALGKLNQIGIDVTDILSNTESIESKVDVVDGNVDTILSNTTSIESKVDTVDGNVDTVLANTISIESKIDSIDSDITLVKSYALDGNTSYEYYEATVQNDTRKVAVGVLDRIIIKVKNDSDPDWSSPISTKTVYLWYGELGDTEPIAVKDSD